MRVIAIETHNSLVLKRFKSILIAMLLEAWLAFSVQKNLAG
ncbi:hypothetical protein PPRY_a1701 [Pseudoalteromonas prydzensis ACAM 620]|nr:hypothetical protein [Pseudoalteromonas prydzensis ACAM 620]